MIADIDIWRAAALLVKQHGEDAMFLASQRADGMLAKGDVDGLSVGSEFLPRYASYPVLVQRTTSHGTSAQL